MCAEWRDIETAPDDGTELLLGGMHPDTGFGFIIGTGCFIKATSRLPWNWRWAFLPTHWMPLPEPPGAPRASARTEQGETPAAPVEEPESPCAFCDGTGWAPRLPTLTEDCER
jgi:hypothetical protein